MRGDSRNISSQPRLLAGAAALLLHAALALPQEVRVNVYTDFYEGHQGYSATTVPGGFAFFWHTSREFCASYDVIQRRMDTRGQFTTGDLPTFQGCPPGPRKPAAAALPGGEILLVAEGDGGAIFGQLLDPSGAPVGPTFVVNQTSGAPRTWPSLAALAGGSYAVVWSRQTDVWIWEELLYGRIVMPDGSMPGPEVQLSSSLSDQAIRSSVVPSSTGGALVVWARTLDAGPQHYDDVRVRTFDATLAPLTAEEVISQGNYPQEEDFSPFAAAGPDGFVVAWNRYVAPGDTDVFARWLNPSGTPSGAEFCVACNPGSSQGGGVCAIDPLGRALITYGDDDLPNSDPGDSFAVYFDEYGNPVSSIFRVHSMIWGVAQGAGTPTMLPDGSFVLAWYSDIQDPNGNGSTYMRRYFFPVSLAPAPGPGSGNPPWVRTMRPDGRIGWKVFPAYAAGGYGANVGTGDLDGDAIDEILTGPGPSGSYGPHVRGFERDGASIAKIGFYAYGTLRYGVKVAGGSIDADGYAEILTAPGAGAVFGPHIRAFDYDGAALSPVSKVSFYAYGTLRWGAEVSGGDIDGDGIREILTGPGPGPAFAPQVRGFNYDGAALVAIAKVNFDAFPGVALGYGVTVTASDMESDGVGGYGDGYQEIVAGIGPDPDPLTGSPVRLYDFDGVAVALKTGIWPPYATLFGVRVAGGDVDSGDTEEVVTAPGPDPGATARVICWEFDPDAFQDPILTHAIGPDDFTIFTGMTYGANVAVGTFE